MPPNPILICARSPELRTELEGALAGAGYSTQAVTTPADAVAAMRGRSFVIPDDVQALVVPTLAHRLMPSGQSRLRGKAVVDILREVTTKVPVPVEESWSENAA